MIGWSVVREVFVREIAVWKIDQIISISLDLIIFLPMFIFILQYFLTPLSRIFYQIFPIL